jgi:hypothetical protein
MLLLWTMLGSETDETIKAGTTDRLIIGQRPFCLFSRRETRPSCLHSVEVDITCGIPREVSAVPITIPLEPGCLNWHSGSCWEGYLVGFVDGLLYQFPVFPRYDIHIIPQWWAGAVMTVLHVRFNWVRSDLHSKSGSARSAKLAEKQLLVQAFKRTETRT